MKLSLAWIFDHIDVGSGTWQQFDATMIARRFNEVTAEIEHVENRSLDLSQFFLVFKRGNAWVVDETGDTVELKDRTASDFVREDGADTAFLVKKTDTGYAWATRQDFSADSEGLVPAVHAPKEMCNGAWKKLWETTDIIIEVDNKSITHRPDMWGHRGFAREIAPFVGKKLRPVSDFLHPQAIKRVAPANDSAGAGSAFVIKNEVPELCKIFNGLFIPSIENRPCDLKIMGRLMAVGAKPISGLVDLTNYITHDWGQPVHAYDADKIVDRTIVIRKADQGEELMLLDSSSIELAFEDMVIADPDKTVCLAGVKGGMNDSVSKDTTALFFEAANFDPGYVRRSGLRHKTRTDSSARFEKSLDRNLAVEAIQRFLALAKSTGTTYEAENEIISLGTPAEPKIIKLEHAFLEKRMGIELDPAHVKNLLTQIEFGVEFDATTRVYTVTVPTFRASKDIDNKEDILEEVVRTYGFANIPLIMPTITRRPFSLVPVMRHRAIKRFFAQVAGLVEMQNYAFYDEDFLRSINLEMPSPVELLNPVSENFRRLITSLVPGLLKNVIENQHHHDALRFFESGRIWQEVNGEVVERKSLAACCIVKRTQVDFYDGKAEVIALFDSLGIGADLITWEQVAKPTSPWYKPYQTATFALDGKVMGIIGKGSPLMYAKLGMPDELDGIFVELDLEAILALEVPVTRFEPLPRYQETYLDFSFMVPLALRTAELERELKAVSPLVQRVELLDFFEKESWDNQRSLTFRMWVLDHEGTVDKAALEILWQATVARTQPLGAVLRTA
jgi:phenylalanyl-tRNA synthetase beta chain